VTTITEVRSASFWLHAQHIFATLQLCITLLCCEYIFHHRVWYRTLYLRYACSKFGHHPHPQATFVPNFISFVLNHSLTQSPNLFDAPGTEACTLEQQVT